jgi:hypothetical protein
MLVIMVMVMVMIVVVVMVVAAIVMMLVAGNVLMVVPIVADEVHGTAARIVFSAMLRPVSLMTRSHVKVHWLPDECRIPVDHDGPGINQCRALRYIADVDLPEEAGLAYID